MEGRVIDVEAAIFDTLPMSVLLGADFPHLYELLEGDRSKTTEDVFAVTTRATEKERRAAAENYHRKEEACGVRPNVIVNDNDSADVPAWLEGCPRESICIAVRRSSSMDLAPFHKLPSRLLIQQTHGPVSLFRKKGGGVWKTECGLWTT